VSARPDIEVAVSAAARELRFRSSPRMRTSGGDAGSRRERLPAQVEPGRRYRNPWVMGWLRARVEARPQRKRAASRG
jgi:hypothetical protein